MGRALLGGFENAAQTACGGTVTADGATFRVTKLEAAFKVPSGARIGTATSTFIMSGYDVNSVTGLTIKMSRQVQASGTLLLGSSAPGC